MASTPERFTPAYLATLKPGRKAWEIVRDEMTPDQRRALYMEMAKDRPSYRTLLADLGVCQMVDNLNRNVLAEAEAEKSEG